MKLFVNFTWKKESDVSMMCGIQVALNMSDYRNMHMFVFCTSITIIIIIENGFCSFVVVFFLSLFLWSKHAINVCVFFRDNQVLRFKSLIKAVWIDGWMNGWLSECLYRRWKCSIRIRFTLTLSTPHLSFENWWIHWNTWYFLIQKHWISVGLCINFIEFYSKHNGNYVFYFV